MHEVLDAKIAKRNGRGGGGNRGRPRAARAVAPVTALVDGLDTDFARQYLPEGVEEPEIKIWAGVHSGPEDDEFFHASNLRVTIVHVL